MDTFISRLVREGLLVIDPLVGTVLQGHSQALSIRSVQYRFLHATGLTNKTVRQITRAQQAYALLEQGVDPRPEIALFLPRLIGLGKAMELCFTGDKVSAADALALGLVNKVVPAEELMKATHELAQKLAKLPTAGIGLTKRLLYQSLNSDLESQLEAEAVAQETAGLTADHREGVRAFFEKRAPNFQGK